MKNFIKQTSILSIAIAVAFVIYMGVQIAQGAWSDPLPGTVPPNNNAAEPINVSSALQTKSGSLVINGFIDVLSNSFFRNKLGIMSTGQNIISSGEQSLKLDVEGAVGAQWYCDENGNNCVSGGSISSGGGGDFIPIMPVLFSPTPVGTWTALDLSSAIPAGTKEVGGSVRVRATGGVAAFAIASISDGTGQKEIFFQGDVSGGTLLASSFRLSLLEDRRLYHISTGLSYNEIKISEYK